MARRMPGDTTEVRRPTSRGSERPAITIRLIDAS
jgi:hypothetical protein